MQGWKGQARICLDIYILVILFSKQFATFLHISLNNCICYICACLCYLQFIYHVSSEKMVSKMLLNWLCCFYSLFQILQCCFTCILLNLASAIYKFCLPCIRKIGVQIALSLHVIYCFQFFVLNFAMFLLSGHSFVFLLFVNVISVVFCMCLHLLSADLFTMYPWKNSCFDYS